jgi:hypothetical protein
VNASTLTFGALAIVEILYEPLAMTVGTGRKTSSTSEGIKERMRE